MLRLFSSKNESSIHKVVKDKEILASFSSVVPQLQVIATVYIKCFIMVGKALPCTVRYFERDHIHVTSIIVYHFNYCILLSLISHCA